MAESVIGALRVVLGLDTAKFQDDLKKSQGALAGFAKSVGTIAAGIGLEKLVEEGFAKLKEAIFGTIEALDKLGKEAQKVGIPVEEFQGLTVAAKLADVSMESLSRSLGILSKNMVEAGKGSGDQIKLFQQLGVSVRNADGTMRSVTDVLADISDKFSESGDGAQKTAAALNLLGRAGKELIPLLNEGGDSLREMAQVAKNMGLVMDKETVAAATHLQDNFKLLGLATQGLYNQLVQQLLPAFIRITDAWVTNAKTGETVRTVVYYLVEAFKTLAIAGLVVFNMFDAITNVIAGFAAALVAKATGDTEAVAKAWEMVGKGIEGIIPDLSEARQKVLDLFAAISITVHKGMEPFGEQSTKVADAIANLNLRTAELLGRFNALGPGSAALLASLNLTDKAGKNLSTTFEGLSEEQKKVVIAQQQFQAAQFVQQSLPAWMQLEDQLGKIEKAMTLAGYSAEQTGEVIARVARNSASSWQAATVDITQNLAAGFKAFAAQNKSLAGVAKAAAIASAIANTYQAATKALATFPPPLSYAAAAATIVAGLGMVANIQAQQFATGGSFKVGGGMTGIDSQMVAFHATPGEMVDIRRPGQASSTTAGAMEITLKTPRTRDFFADNVRELVDVLNTAAPDGYRLKIA
jgi:hypothetical protein